MMKTNNVKLEENSSEDPYKDFCEAMNVRQLTPLHDVNEGIMTVKLIVDEEYGNTDLFDIENFVKQIIATDEPAFKKVELNPFACMWSSLPLASYYSQINFFIDSYQSQFSYSPHIELFYTETFKFLTLHYRFSKNSHTYSDLGRWEVEIFNELICRIRLTAKSLQFKKKVKSRKHNLKRNEVSALFYINNLFERFARLMVVRMDFFFSNADGDQTSVSAARTYLNRFLNNKRSNSIFKNLVGYLWKLEDGKKKGPHFHFLFFFDGSKSCKDAFAGMCIGKYWARVSEGRGKFFNVNANYKTYLNNNADIGIGMINHFESDKRRGLTYIVKYFFKAEQYLLAKSLTKLRTYGHGGLHKTCCYGRPRGI